MQVAFQRVCFEQIMDIEAFSVCFSIPPASLHIMSLYVTRYPELERDHTLDHYPSLMIAGDERKVYLDLGVVERTCILFGILLQTMYKQRKQVTLTHFT